MSLLNFFGKTNAPKQVPALPVSIKRKIANYVAENLNKDSDEFFFWAQVNLKIVKPEGIKCLASDLKDIYENEISKENWDLDDQNIELEQTSLVIPRVNSTPILVGKMKASELNEIKVAYERYKTESERDAEIEKLTESFLSKGLCVLKCELLDLYRELFANKEQVVTKEFKMQFQELPMSFLRSTEHIEQEFKDELLPPELFKEETFILLWQNNDWLILAEARELEYLILIHGGTIEYEEDNSFSKDVIPLCIELSSEAIDEFVVKYGCIFNKHLVLESIKNGIYNKAHNTQYLVKNQIM